MPGVTDDDVHGSPRRRDGTLRTRSTAAATLTAVLLLGGGTLTSAASPGTTSPGTASPEVTVSGVDSGAAAARPGAEVSTVTLLTGDRVTVTTLPDGRHTVTVRAAPGREGVGFLRQDDGERLYVVPSDVASLVPARLDRALFDVIGLAEAGYGSEGTLPVIVQHADPADRADAADPANRARAGTVTAPDWKAAGITPERELESVAAVSDDVSPAAATTLLATLRAQDGGTSSRAATAVPEIERVWLDAQVTVVDADSAPQIGAPQAWDAGFTGDGLTLAVLDTGIDATHPDLDDSVVAARDFTGTGDVSDGHGHGTHVAAIAAGSGDASGGENTGIAPDADLMVGKVIDDDGHGELSGIIEGMEWAASEGADIVNISLTVPEYTDGTDPGAAAVDALSRQYGTLFVIAVGNDYEYGTIGTPGSASSALTVGAVDDADQVTDFSSKGPRADGVIKPDIAAPGEGIVAARAAGTAKGDVIDDLHVAVSGTSMAAPHVAGAAAVLSQARPELSGPELKAALMGSADPTGAPVWEVGAGRVFLPSALAQDVLASPASLSFGAFEYPQQGTSSDTITYTNGGSEDLVLDLDVAVTGPEGRAADVTLTERQVKLPAGGSAEVEATVDETAGEIGLYGGAIVATTDDGRTVRTPVGWNKEPELFELTFEAVGRDGEPHEDWTNLTLVNVDDAEAFTIHRSFTRGEATYRVPQGTYFATATLVSGSEDGDQERVEEVVNVLRPEFGVDGDSTVTLDAREAVPVSFDTPRPADTTSVQLDVQRVTADGVEASSGYLAEGDTAVFVTPTEPVTVGGFDHVTVATLAGSDDGDEEYTYDLAFEQDTVTTGTFAVERADLAAVRSTYADLGEELVASSGWAALPAGRDVALSSLTDVEPGSSRTEYVNSRDVEWSKTAVFQTEDQTQGAFVDPGTVTYEPGSWTETTFGAPVHSPLGAAQRTEGQFGLFPGAWSDSEGHESFFFGTDELNVTARQDGEVVADGPGNWVELTVPEGGADYEVSLTASRGSDVWPTSWEVSGRWTFRADASSDDPALPLLDVRYDVAGLGLDGVAPRRTEVGVDVVGGEGGAVTGFSWSADDGATWVDAPFRDGRAVVSAPADAEAVSLRVEAEDGAGSTVTETVTRAYLVK